MNSEPLQYIIAPSTLAYDFSSSTETYDAMLEHSNVPLWSHVDVLDPSFGTIAQGYDALKIINKCKTNLVSEIEVHSMTEDPASEVAEASNCGGTIFTFHLESILQQDSPSSYVTELLESVNQLGMKYGIAISPATQLSELDKFPGLSENAYVINIMTVVPGKCGQAFMPECLEKVRSLRESRSGHIEVDGGITPETIGLAKSAGANVFVVGSYLTKVSTFQEGFANLINALNI